MNKTYHRPIGMRISLTFFLAFTAWMYLPVNAAEKDDNYGNYNQDVIDDYRQLIEKLQTEHGPFDPRLSDPLLGLGHALKNQGAYSEAADIFKRAIYIKRVNNGLYDIDQIAILENIIECNAALHNWDEVDDEYHYLLWVFNKAYPDPDPARLDALDKVTGWHIAAFNLPTGSQPARHLITLRDLNETAVELTEHLYGKSGQELASRLYKLALSEYYIAVGIQRGGPNGVALTDSLLIMNRNPSYFMTSRKLVARNYQKGVNLLKRIISIYSNAGDSEPQGEAMAMIYLADWNLLFNKQRAASRLYKGAYKKLLASGINKTLINNYFSSPVILPLENFSTRPEPAALVEYMPVQMEKAADKDEQGYIQKINEKPFISWSDSLPGLAYPAYANSDVISPSNNSYAYAVFDVSKKGLAEKIRILDYQSHDVKTRKHAYDMLWSMQFRPKLVSGRAVPSRNYLLHYILPE